MAQQEQLIPSSLQTDNGLGFSQVAHSKKFQLTAERLKQSLKPGIHVAALGPATAASFLHLAPTLRFIEYPRTVVQLKQFLQLMARLTNGLTDGLMHYRMEKAFCSAWPMTPAILLTMRPLRFWI